MSKHVIPTFLATMTCVLLILPVTSADDLVVDGTSMVIDSDTQVDGSVWVENGGTLTIRNARLTLVLDYDEEHHIDVAGSSRLIIDNARIDSTGGQFWFELYGDESGDPSMEVSGDDSWLTNHSGIRPFDATHIVITGGDVEELQVRDQVTVELSDAATYPVFFFDGDTATIDGLDTGDSVTRTVAVPGGWSMALTNAWVEGYQIDLMNGADVTLSDGDGIVLSVHTPGDLGPGLQVVEGITSEHPISGALTNLGSTFTFTSSNIALINVYVFGNDRVLLRDLHVNEVNAEQESELIIGQAGYTTRLNCNLCQVYDRATFTVENVVIDASDNLPSATASYHDDEYGYDEGYGVMTFREVDLRQTDLTVREHGTMILHNCQYDQGRLQVLDATATFSDYVLAVDFSAAPRSGPAPLAVQLTDLSELRLGGATVTPESWSWQLGDGSTSAQQSPNHTYTEAGSYTVSLTVSSPGGSTKRTRSDYIVVSGTQPASCQGEPVYIAAAAHAAGDAGSVWRSDIAFFNPTGTTAEIGLQLYSGNGRGSCVAAPSAPASASTHIEDVLLTSFGLSSGSGGVAVYSESDLVVTSRTYNLTTKGTFGQTIPGRRAGAAIGDGESAVLIQLHENQAFRTNIGFLNISAGPVSVEVDLYTESGSFVGRYRRTLGPYSYKQVNRIFADYTSQEISNGRAEVRVSGGAVLAYASVVDNQTSDPSYIEAAGQP
jgi:PKD repeat protein